MYILQTIQFVWRSFQASSQTGQVHCCLSTFISFFDIFFSLISQVILLSILVSVLFTLILFLLTWLSFRDKAAVFFWKVNQ